MNSGYRKGPFIHLAFGKLRQQRIGLLFLFKALVQHSLFIAQV
jgi:hypothetical protein